MSHYFFIFISYGATALILALLIGLSCADYMRYKKAIIKNEHMAQAGWFLKSRFLPLLIFLLVVIFFALGLRLGDPSRLPAALEGKPLPDFSLPALESADKNLNSDMMRAQAPFLLNIWASWCAPCRVEHPLLMALAGENIVAFGINYKDNPKAAQRFLQQLGNPFQLSGRDEKGRAAIQLGVYGVPETFIISREGIILYRHAGALTEEIIRDEILPRLIGNDYKDK